MPSKFALPSLLFLITCTGASQGQVHELIGYWHNWNDASAPYIPLDQVDPRYSVIEVAFALPASGSTSNMQFVPAQVSPSAFIAQVQALQAAGKKVLISVGGATATVRLNSDAERDEFVSSMLGILGTYGFDGMDLDLEGASVLITGGTIAAPVDQPIIRLIAAVNSIAAQYEATHGHHMMLTMAPETAYVQGGQSAYGGIWGAYLPIIHGLRDRLDILQVQLYNSGSMYGIDGGIYGQGTADFVVSQTEAVIHGFNTGGGYFAGLPPEKVAIALPACPASAGGGYVTPAVLASAVNYLLGTGPKPGSYTRASSYPSLLGLMTWSINWDAVSTCNPSAYRYAQGYQDIFGLSQLVRARVMLEGPFDPALQLMRDSLRAHQLVPAAEPFTAAGFAPVAGTTGQRVASGVLSITGANAIV
ncbi:MAG: chitinase, partial [Flavobacteriales bacterium]